MRTDVYCFYCCRSSGLYCYFCYCFYRSKFHLHGRACVSVVQIRTYPPDYPPAYLRAGFTNYSVHIMMHGRAKGPAKLPAGAGIYVPGQVAAVSDQQSI